MGKSCAIDLRVAGSNPAGQLLSAQTMSLLIPAFGRPASYENHHMMSSNMQKWLQVFESHISDYATGHETVKLTLIQTHASIGYLWVSITLPRPQPHPCSHSLHLSPPPPYPQPPPRLILGEYKAAKPSFCGPNYGHHRDRF